MADALNQSNIERDIEDAGKFVNTKQVITPRYGGKFKSAPLIAAELAENGMFQPFSTEAELKAYVPTIVPTVAKALDTKKVWMWKQTSAAGVEPKVYAWVDSGSSELDQANQYSKKLITDEVQKIQINLLSKAGTNIMNVFDVNDQYVMFINQLSQLFIAGADRAVQDYLKEVDLLNERIKTGTYNNSNLAEFSDNAENIYALFDKFAGLHLSGLDGSVQENFAGISDIKENIKSIQNRIANLAEFTDDHENIYAYFNRDAKLFLSDLSHSVQTILNNIKKRESPNAFNHDARSLVDDRVQKYLVSCLSSGAIAAMPFSQAPHSYTPPADLINAKVEQGNRSIIDTVYQKDDGVVHPHILEFRNGFLGYRYILGLTPYFENKDKYENPCMYGSHDLKNFELIKDVVQPFAERPAQEVAGQGVYNSDDFFAYDFYAGDLMFCWRRNYEIVNARVEVWGRRTKNGLDWSGEEKLYDSRDLDGLALSPSIIFNFQTQLYEMYVVERIDGSTRIRKMTSKTLKNAKWTHVKYFNAIPNANVWHLDVRYVGNKIYALAHDDAMTGATSTKNLYLGVYDDVLDEFAWSDQVLVGEHFDPYKATFTPILDSENDQISLQVLWTTRSGGSENIWKLYSSQSNKFNF